MSLKVFNYRQFHYNEMISGISSIKRLLRSSKKNEEMRKRIDDETFNRKERMVEDMETTQKIQVENLEKEIERMPKPVMKYSRRLIGLFKAEAALIKLCEYDEAKKVRTVIDKLRPKEEKRFWASFNDKIESKRSQLAATHQLDQDRLDEKLKGEFFKAARKKDRETQVMTQRIKNHTKDMTHAYVLQTQLKPEMSVNPSALWQQREGFKDTSAVLRGRQLLDHVHGKRAGESVHAETLVGTHNFEQPLQDTMDLS